MSALPLTGTGAPADLVWRGAVGTDATAGVANPALAYGVWTVSPSAGVTFVYADINGDGRADGKIQVHGTVGPSDLPGVTVAAVNNAPTADDVSATGAEDADSIEITLTGTDPDASDAIDSFTLSSLPSQGTLYTNAALTDLAATGVAYPASGNSLTLYFVPAADFNGDASFGYAASDGDVNSTGATAMVQVSAVADIADDTRHDQRRHGGQHRRAGQRHVRGPGAVS